MQYAKVKSNTLVDFPYTFEKLQQDNPHTEYDDRFTLLEWYQQTEDAVTNGYNLVEVEQDINIPTIDPITETLSPMDTPILVDNKWVVGWNKITKTESEIESYRAMLAEEAVINGT